MRSCCIAQGTISSHLGWNTMEDNVRKSVCVYIYMCVYIHMHIYKCVCIYIYVCVFIYMTGSLFCTVEISRTL